MSRATELAAQQRDAAIYWRINPALSSVLNESADELERLNNLNAELVEEHKQYVASTQELLKSFRLFLMTAPTRTAPMNSVIHKIEAALTSATKETT